MVTHESCFILASSALTKYESFETTSTEALVLHKTRLKILATDKRSSLFLPELPLTPQKGFITSTSAEHAAASTTSAAAGTLPQQALSSTSTSSRTISSSSSKPVPDLDGLRLRGPRECRLPPLLILSRITNAPRAQCYKTFYLRNFLMIVLS